MEISESLSASEAYTQLLDSSSKLKSAVECFKNEEENDKEEIEKRVRRLKVRFKVLKALFCDDDALTT